MKVRLGWCAVAVALVACSEGPTSPDSPQFAKGGKQGVADPQVAVHINGSVFFRSAGPSNTGIGSCLAGGAWQNDAGGYTTAPNHPNCASINAGSSVDVGTFLPGRHGTATLLTDNEAWVWYRSGADAVQGSGTFFAGSWTVDATQTLLNGPGNFMNRQVGMVAVACNTNPAVGCHPANMTW